MRVEWDLEVCCRYQGNEVQKAVPNPTVSLDAVCWFTFGGILFEVCVRWYKAIPWSWQLEARLFVPEL